MRPCINTSWPQLPYLECPAGRCSSSTGSAQQQAHKQLGPRHTKSCCDCGSSCSHISSHRVLPGDAILNVRKAKLIPSYELCIKVKWEGTTAEGQPGSGLIELPYVADENHDEDPEIRCVAREQPRTWVPK